MHGPLNVKEGRKVSLAPDRRTGKKSTEWVASWASALNCMFWGKRKSLALTGI